MGIARSMALLGIMAAGFGAGGGAAVQVLLARHDKVAFRDHLVVRRLDVEDANGVTRLLLAAPTPDPLVDGKRMPRRYPVAGMAVFDARGNERGGIGIADVAGGVPVVALDHRNFDAVGWKVLPDGTVALGMNDRGSKPAQRMLLQLAADGTPAVELADRQERVRLRLSIAPDGAGELQFLDATGKVVRTIGPEALPGDGRR